MVIAPSSRRRAVYTYINIKYVAETCSMHLHRAAVTLIYNMTRYIEFKQYTHMYTTRCIKVCKGDNDDGVKRAPSFI